MKPIYQTEAIVQEINTQILVQSFADRVLVLVTQLGKVGCLIQATLPQTIQLPAPTRDSSNETAHLPKPPPPPPAVELTPILGHPPTPELHTFYNLLAAQLATTIWSSQEAASGNYGTRRPVVVGIALKQQVKKEGDAVSSSLEGQYSGIVNALVRLLSEE